MSLETLSPSHGESGSSASEPEIDWDTLPPPSDEALTGNILPPDTLPNAPICPVCNEPIIRDPSWKRMRKYHPGCKAPTGTPRDASGRATKASKEADEVVAMYRSAVTKIALGVSVFDKYDAFVIMANLDTCCSNLHGVLMRYDKFRTECLAVKGGGSMFGLVIAHAFLLAPIAAHHGLLPGKNIPKLLIDMPFTLFALMERMKEGEESLTKMMKEQYEAARKSQAEREQGKGKRDPYFPGAGGSTVGPS